MTGPLFHFNERGELDKIDNRLYLVPEFRVLLDRDNGMQHMKYVYCFCDYYSPYVREPDLNQRARLVNRDVYQNKYTPEEDTQILDAIFKYNELQIHPLHEQYRVMETKRFEMTEAIDALDAKQDIAKVMKLSKDLSSYVEGIDKLMEKILEKNSKIGGLSNLDRNLSIIEKRLRKEQVPQ